MAKEILVHSIPHKPMCSPMLLSIFRFVRSKNLEASQNIFANLASKATLSSSMRRSSMSAVLSTNGLTENTLVGRSTTKAGTATARPINKFKTSGIVAAAVTKPSKKHKSDATFPVLKLDGAAAAAVSEASLKSPTTVKEFVKKVKTKFKKRKNKSEKV